jgi:hypothetical protein
MKYSTYLSKSLQVFIICFIIGTFIDTQFHKLQKKYTEANEFAFIFGFAQLITVINVTYFLYVNKFFHLYFEEYSPNALFSTFLLSLQSNMINNFKHVMRYEYFDV